MKRGDSFIVFGHQKWIIQILSFIKNLTKGT